MAASATENQNSYSQNLPRFVDVGGVSGIIPCLKPSGIRWLIYKDKEFCRKCVFRLGRKILIGVPELFSFVESQRTR